MSWRVFDLFYKDYDRWYERNWEVFESEVRALEALRLMGRGLDVGVGTGVFAKRLGVEFGVDPAVNPLKVARKRGIGVAAGVGEFLPFRSRCFDYAVITVSICFFKEPERVLEEVARVLRPEGRLAVCFVPKNSEWGKHYVNLGRKGHRFYRYARFYDLNELNKMLEGAGFVVDEVRATLSYPPEAEKQVEEPSNKVKGRSFVCMAAHLR